LLADALKTDDLQIIIALEPFMQSRTNVPLMQEKSILPMSNPNSDCGFGFYVKKNVRLKVNS
jgi:hypothetical protein